MEVTGYKIYRGGIQITTTSNTSYSDIGLDPSTTYTYTVSAYDAAGNESGETHLVSSTGNVYYVSPSGNDNNSGTEELPFATVQKGIDSTVSGDTVYIKAGTYDLSGYTKTIDYPLTLLGEDKDSTVLDNFGLLTIKDSLTVKHLKFTGASRIFYLLAEEGDTLDGFRIEDCIFDNIPQAVSTAYGSAGIITNVHISNNDFLDLNAGKVQPIGLDQGTLSNIYITNNNFINLTSTVKLCVAVRLGGGDTDTNMTVKGNYFENISGPDGPEVHAVLAYGENIDISYNTVVDFPPGTDKEALYMKAHYSTMSNNVLINSTSYQGAIAIKGSGGISSYCVVENNRVQSNQAGIGIYWAGGQYPTYKDNYVKMSNTGVSGIGLYIYHTDFTPAVINGNYSEASHIGQYISGAKNTVISGNTLISYDYDPPKSRPVYIAGWNDNVTETDNLTTVFAGQPSNTPTAAASADIISGETPLTINFSSSGSMDPNGEIASYDWNFHDGSTSSDTNPSHTYTSARTYAATLIVTDEDGFKDMAYVIIRVSGVASTTDK